jgi:spermidine/putrescine transport system permease protein
MKNRFTRFAFPYAIWMLVLIIVPMILVFMFAISDTNGGDLSTFTFDLESILRTTESNYIKVLYRSLRLAFLTTLITLVVGYPVSYILSFSNIKRKNIILLLIILPMWMNMLLRTYAWKSILSRNGLLNQFLELIHLPTIDILNTETAVMIGMTYNFLPFMIFPIYTALEKLDRSYIEAARDLGATKIQTFLKVVFPLSIPGILSGVIMVFLPAASSFVIPSYLGGGKVDMIGNVIERQFLMSNNWNFGSALSLVLMLVILLSMRLLNGRDKNKGDMGVW